MDHKGNQPASNTELSNEASWQEYYEYAQQCYAAGQEEEAQVYYDIAQRLYEASGDDIGQLYDAADPGTEAASHADIAAAGQTMEQQPNTVPQSTAPAPQPASQPSYIPAAQPVPQESYIPAPASVPPAQPTPSQPSMNDFSDINSINGERPSIAPPDEEKEVSEGALKEWAEEYTSMAPEAFDPSQGAKKNKTVVMSAIGLGVLIAIAAGVYLYWQNRPTVIQPTAPATETTTVTETQNYTSRPSATNNGWNRSGPSATARAHRARRNNRGGNKARARANGASNKSDDFTKQKGNKKIGSDPLAGLDLDL